MYYSQLKLKVFVTRLKKTYLNSYFCLYEVIIRFQTPTSLAASLSRKRGHLRCHIRISWGLLWSKLSAAQTWGQPGFSSNLRNTPACPSLSRLIASISTDKSVWAIIQTIWRNITYLCLCCGGGGLLFWISCVCLGPLLEIASAGFCQSVGVRRLSSFLLKPFSDTCFALSILLQLTDVCVRTWILRKLTLLCVPLFLFLFAQLYTFISWSLSVSAVSLWVKRKQNHPAFIHYALIPLSFSPIFPRIRVQKQRSNCSLMNAPVSGTF